MKRNLTIPDEIVVARMLAKESHPYFTALLMSLHPVESPGIGTMAVDKYGRLYYDPAYLAKTPDPLLLGAAREMGHRGMGRLDDPDTSLDDGPRLQAPPSFCV